MYWPLVNLQPIMATIRIDGDATLLDAYLAVGGEGILGDTWADKPHRLVYDLTRSILRERAMTAKLAAAYARMLGTDVQDALLRSGAIAAISPPQPSELASPGEHRTWVMELGDSAGEIATEIENFNSRG